MITLTGCLEKLPNKRKRLKKEIEGGIFLEYQVPKLCISVAGLVTNESGEVLLLRTHWRFW